MTTSQCILPYRANAATILSRRDLSLLSRHYVYTTQCDSGRFDVFSCCCSRVVAFRCDPSQQFPIERPRPRGRVCEVGRGSARRCNLAGQRVPPPTPKAHVNPGNGLSSQSGTSAKKAVVRLLIVCLGVRMCRVLSWVNCSNPSATCRIAELCWLLTLDLFSLLLCSWGVGDGGYAIPRQLPRAAALELRWPFFVPFFFLMYFEVSRNVGILQGPDHWDMSNRILSLAGTTVHEMGVQ